MPLPFKCATLCFTVVAWSAGAGPPTPGAALCHCSRLVFHGEYVDLVPTQARSQGSVRGVPAPRVV